MLGPPKKFRNNPKRITAPTFTKTRGSGGGFYLTKLNRRLLHVAPERSLAGIICFIPLNYDKCGWLSLNTNGSRVCVTRWLYGKPKKNTTYRVSQPSPYGRFIIGLAPLQPKECLRLLGLPDEIHDLAKKGRERFALDGDGWKYRPVPLVRLKVVADFVRTDVMAKANYSCRVWHVKWYLPNLISFQDGNAFQDNQLYKQWWQYVAM